MRTTEHDFQLHAPAEPEFRLVPPQPEHSAIPEMKGEQLDFSELFGAVALFSFNRHGISNIPEREAA